VPETSAASTVALPQVGYYVHHHGHGHWRRAQAIAQCLDCPVTLIGSNLPALPAPLLRLDLPGDTAPGMQVARFATLHYAPLAVDGLRERMALLADWMRRHWPCVLVVDVSVEVALLARLLGVPTVYVRQHGQRDDPAHLQAYACASTLLAPWPAFMDSLAGEQGSADNAAILARTRYSGWLSRYPQGRGAAAEAGRVLVIIGQGGTAIGVPQLHALARACADYRFRVIGLPSGTLADEGAAAPANLIDLGQMAEPFDELCRAEIVIGSAGDGVVGEVASLGCRYVAIAESRPFDEQLQQARRLQALGLAIGLEAWPDGERWPEILQRARALDPDQWQRGGAPADSPGAAARVIEDTLHRHFVNSRAS
jgi:predicted glycosyltransferase